MDFQPEGVPDDALEDVPPDGAVRLVQESDSDGGHWRDMDKEKLKFARWLIFLCIGIVVVLTACQFPSDNFSQYRVAEHRDRSRQAARYNSPGLCVRPHTELSRRLEHNLAG